MYFDDLLLNVLVIIVYITLMTLLNMYLNKHARLLMNYSSKLNLTNEEFIRKYNLDNKKKEVSFMSTHKTGTRYDEDFKRTLVELYHNGKTQASLIKEYGVSQTALTKWIKQYSTVETDDGEVLTAKQVKELQKRNAQLEEENLILKKAIAIFTPHSNKD